MVEDGFMLNSVSFENGGTPFPISSRYMGLIIKRNTNPKGFPTIFHHMTIELIHPTEPSQLSGTRSFERQSSWRWRWRRWRWWRWRWCSTGEDAQVECNIGFAGEHLFFVKTRFTIFLQFAMLALFCLRFGVFNVGGFYKRKLTEVLDSIWIIEMLPSSN